ncbi:hypothetical protein [Erythrobacter colymbi]|uniref:hypothetical protein n=1 Tax=Erythrobacter colymbi TaxID=1161202 RepID=UPI000A3C1B8D|nr:hypothetical protein [Erythrobacter colymbi]
MTIHRPVFGRKQSPAVQRAAPQAAAHDAPASRILPAELWDGPAGATLREAGMEPDSPANQRMTQERADALQDEQIALQRQFLDRVNAQLPAGTQVCAYAMLPWALWNGPYGHMLAVTCGLWPQQPWNTMLLAADQRASFVLDLPEHPGGYPPDFVPQLERLLGELRQDMDAEMARARAVARLDWDAVAAWEEKRVAMIPKIIAMAHYVGRVCIGEAAFDRHREMFGATLGWPGAR